MRISCLVEIELNLTFFVKVFSNFFEKFVIHRNCPENDLENENLYFSKMESDFTDSMNRIW